MFLAYSHFNNFGVTHGHITAIINLLDIMLSALSHSQSVVHHIVGEVLDAAVEAVAELTSASLLLGVAAP